MLNRSVMGLSLSLILTPVIALTGVGISQASGDRFQVAQQNRGLIDKEKEEEEKNARKRRDGDNRKAQGDQGQQGGARHQNDDRGNRFQRNTNERDQNRRDNVQDNRDQGRNRFENRQENVRERVRQEQLNQQEAERKAVEERKLLLQKRLLERKQAEEKNDRLQNRKQGGDDNRDRRVFDRDKRDNADRGGRDDNRDRRVFDRDDKKNVERSRDDKKVLPGRFDKVREDRREKRRVLQDRIRRKDDQQIQKLRIRREVIRNRLKDRFDDKRRARQLEFVRERQRNRRERDQLRARRNIGELREALERKKKRRIIGDGGRFIDFETRSYRFRKHRYRDWGRRRYVNGLHVYMTPPEAAFIDLALYVIDGAEASVDEIEDALEAPLAVDIEETYEINDVIEDPEIRRKVRSVNLDSITFESGSSEISEEQLETLDKIAEAISNVLKRHPKQVFLIEGYTDAEGEEEYNQSLSEDRAAAVKDALIQQYGIPEENLVDVGYGEEFLKIDTEEAEEENRRVAIRNISPLIGREYVRRRR